MMIPTCRALALLLALATAPLWACSTATNEVPASRGGAARPGLSAPVPADTSLFSAVVQAFLPLVNPAISQGKTITVSPRPLKSGLLEDPFAEVDPAIVRARYEAGVWCVVDHRLIQHFVV